MLRQSKVISISLPKNIYLKLEQIRKKEAKSRSELIRSLIRFYEEEKDWKKIFTLGKRTKEKFNIQSEEDILRIIIVVIIIAVIIIPLAIKLFSITSTENLQAKGLLSKLYSTIKKTNVSSTEDCYIRFDVKR